MKARSLQQYQGEVLKKIDDINKKLRLNISSPAAILRTLIVEAYPSEFNSSKGVFLFTSQNKPNESEFVRKMFRQLFDKKRTKNDLLSDVIKFVNENISTILTFNKLKFLFAAYFSIFQRYRRYLSDVAVSELTYVDYWEKSFETYIDDVMVEMDNPAYVSENINQLRQVMRSHTLMPADSGRITSLLNSLTALSEVYRGELIDELVCEFKPLFSVQQRKIIARNLWNRCGMVNYDSTEKSLKALLFFYDDIEVELSGEILNRLTDYINENHYPISLKAESIRTLYASLKSLDDEDRVLMANYLIKLMTNGSEVVRKQALQSFVENQLFITSNLLDELITRLLEMLRSPHPEQYAGVIDILIVLYDRGHDELRENLVRVMHELISDNSVGEAIRIDAFRFLHVKFESIERSKKHGTLQICMRLIDTARYSIARIAAAFLNHYRYFLNKSDVQSIVHCEWSEDKFSADEQFLQQIVIKSELSHFMLVEKRKIFCDFVLDHLLTVTDMRAIVALEQAFVNLLPTLTVSQLIHYLQKIVSAAHIALNRADPETGENTQDAYQARFMSFLVRSLSISKIAIEANLICDDLIDYIRRSNNNVECVIGAIDVLVLLQHDIKTNLRFMITLFELMVHPSIDVRQNAMRILNCNFQISLPFIYTAINDFIKHADMMIDKLNVPILIYLSEILSSLRNVISRDNFNNIVYLLLNNMDSRDGWDSLNQTDREKVYTALNLNLDKMDHHMLIMLLSRLRRIISDRVSTQPARGLFFTAYDALQQHLKADLLVGFATQQDLASPDEMISAVMAFSRR